MKLLFITVSILLLASCNSNYMEVNVATDKFDNKEILDSWAMCATSNNGMMYQMNSCPTITFTKRGTGYVVKSTLITESFTWTLDKESMKIIYKTNSTNSTFPDTFYYASFNREKELVNLTLRHNDNFFYLSRFAQGE